MAQGRKHESHCEGKKESSSEVDGVRCLDVGVDMGTRGKMERENTGKDN